MNTYLGLSVSPPPRDCGTRGNDVNLKLVLFALLQVTELSAYDPRVL